MPGPKTSVVIPNWNGAQRIGACLDSLLAQTAELKIIVVDNGSTDGSATLVEEKYPSAVLIKHKKNLGFAGGVNAGIHYAIKSGSQYVALLNNDAVAERDWAKNLANFLDINSVTGIAASKIIDADKKHLDSTGDLYTSWGLPYPRGRGETVSNQYDDERWVFGASGGASMYRAKMFEEIGLFDRAFFAYYEDVDISFRAQLAGWKVCFVPEAIVYHEIGATSAKIKGFATYQTMKNLPMLFWKNVPWQLVPKMSPRFKLAYGAFYLSALRRGQGWPATKGLLFTIALIPRTFYLRWVIRRQRKVSVDYIRSILTYDLPPNAHKLRALRAKWWRLIRKKEA